MSGGKKWRASLPAGRVSSAVGAPKMHATKDISGSKEIAVAAADEWALGGVYESLLSSIRN